MKNRQALCIGLLLALLFTVSSFAEPATDRARKEAEQFFRRNDADKDGELSQSEFPERLKNLFKRIDTNKDGFIDLKEDTTFRAFRNQSRVSNAVPRLPNGIVASRDLKYAHIGEKSLLLDIYAPKKSGSSRPLIVWIHGGGWQSESKDRCPALRFLDQGYVVASINYRLSHEAVFPAQIEDCKAAIRWLRANAKRYHIDPDRIGVWGSSAGGHLVALLGTSGDVQDLEGTSDKTKHSSRVQAVCDFYGPTDLLQMDTHALASATFKHDAPDSPEAKLIGGPIQENRKKADRANPIKYVSADDPPFMIVHGDQDPLVPIHQSQILYDALKKSGVDVKFHTVKGGQHGFGRNPEVDGLVDQFFQKYLQRVSKEE